jgi:hypothetical protein
LKKFANVLALNLLLVGCATITPNKIQDNVASFDASTPSQYNKDNGGLIAILDDGAVITPEAKERYNKLIEMYKIKFKKEKAIELINDAGIKPYKDRYSNDLFLIDNEHLVYFGLMNSWLKEKAAADNLIDKTLDKVN